MSLLPCPLRTAASAPRSLYPPRHPVTAVGLEGTLKGTLLLSHNKISPLAISQSYVGLYQEHVLQTYS